MPADGKLSWATSPRTHALSYEQWQIVQFSVRRDAMRIVRCTRRGLIETQSSAMADVVPLQSAFLDELLAASLILELVNRITLLP